MTNRLEIPELEACVNREMEYNNRNAFKEGPVVKVYKSTTTGEKVFEGVISMLNAPWNMEVSSCQVFSTLVGFLTPRGAITKVERDGEIIYSNQKIQTPYQGFDEESPEGIEALNALRRECFGKGFEYEYREPVRLF